MATARNLLMRLQGDVSAYNRGMNEAASQARLLNRQLELTALQQNQNVRSSRFLAGQTQTTAQIQATFAQRIQQTSQLLQRIESEGGRNTDMYRRYQQRLIDLQIQQERFNQSLRGTQETASRTTSAINNIKVANPLGNIASQAIGYATGQLLYTGMAKASDGLKSGFNFLDTIQQNTLAFETMTKSASEANSTVAQLWKMAKETPFEFPELLTAEKRLIAFKFDLKDIPGLLTAVGNAASGLGLGAEGLNRISLALGQMLAKGKVSGEEMRQLAEAGIGAWDYLAKATGKSTAEVMKLSEKGLLPAKESIKVIVEGMQQDFGGMMEKQSKTFSGLMSTLKDGTNEAFGTVVKPLFNEFTNTILPTAIQKVEQFTEGFKKDGLKGGLTAVLGAEDAKGIITVLDSIASMGSVAGNAISGVAGPIGNITKSILEWKPLIPTILGIVTAMSAMSVAQSVTPGITVLTNAVKWFQMELATGSTITQAFTGTMATLMGPAGWITLGIGAVVGLTTAIVAYNKQQDEMTKRTIEAGNSAAQAQLKNQELIDKYIKLKSEAGESAQKTDELRSITDQLTAAIPGATAVINDQTAALERQKSALDALNSAQRDKIEAGYYSASASIDSKRQALLDAQKAESEARANLAEEQETLKSVSQYQGADSKWTQWQKEAVDIKSKAVSDRESKRIAAEEELKSAQAMIDAWDKINKKTSAPWGGGAPESSYGYSSGADPNYRPPDDAFKQVEKIGSAGNAAANALSSAMSKMQSTSAKAENQFINTMKSFFQQMNSMRDSISSFGSMFEKTTYEHFSPEKIKNRLNQTLKEIEKWRKNLAELTSKGVDEYTMNQLRSLGMSGSGIVAGLNKSSMADLKQSLNSMALIRQGAGAEALTGTMYKFEHEINGKIDVYGVTSEGQLVAIKQIVQDDINKNKDRYGFDPSTMRGVK